MKNSSFSATMWLSISMSLICLLISTLLVQVIGYYEENFAVVVREKREVLPILSSFFLNNYTLIWFLPICALVMLVIAHVKKKIQNDFLISYVIICLGCSLLLVLSIITYFYYTYGSLYV